MFSAAFQALPTPSCIISVDGRVLAWNAAMEAACGLAAGAVLEQPITTLPPFADAALVAWLGEGSGDEFSRPCTIAGRAYLLHQYPLSEGNRLLCLQDRQREIDQNDLLNLVAHDLRTPVAGMSGFLELVANFGGLNARQGQYLRRAQLAVQDMSDLIDQLLDLAWLDSGLQPLLRPMDLYPLVQVAYSRFEPLAERGQVGLELVADPVPWVLGDERRLKHVLSNLIGNAIKYSPRGTTVSMRLRALPDDTVEFSVEDRGVGIPSTALPRIFERYYRVPGQLTEAVEGSGLGLYISADMVRRHGRELRVESTPGVGSRFYFSLEAVRSPEA
ncbi:MAG: PAS domain-containing protein [Anaerolineae bacterium]|nr:PAS domain-containing protein [Anaerolineae bacterium]